MSQRITSQQISQNSPQLRDNLALLTDFDLQVLNYVMRRSWMNTMHFTHDTMATFIGCCKRTVIRAIDKLIILGFLVKHKRPYTSNLYDLTDALRAVRQYVHRYLFQMLWGISLSILSIAAPARNVTLLKDNDYNLLKNSHSRLVNQTVFLKTNNPYDNVSLENHPPNPKLSFEQFDLLLTTEPAPTNVAISTEVDVLREQVELFELLRLETEINREMTESMMQDLTIEQLEELAQFPTETIKYAHKMLTKDMAAGKSIRNPFAYLKAICKAQAGKNPQTGKPIDNRSGAKPLYTAPETIKETSFEWCYKIEPHLHKFVQENHPGLKMTRAYADAHWNKLSREEQQTLIDLYHPDCSCRTITAPEVAPKTTMNSSWAQDDHIGKKQSQAQSLGIDTIGKTYGELCREIAALRDQ